MKRNDTYTVLWPHTHFYINKQGAHFDDRAFCIFHNGWIDCRDTFMLFSIYKTT